MIKNGYLINQLNADYSNKQSQIAQNSYILHERLLGDKEYKEAHFALNKAVFELEKAKYNCYDNVEELKNMVSELKQKKQKAFDKISSAHVKAEYLCSECNDGGRLNDGNLCHCYFKNLTDKAYSFLNVKQYRLFDFKDDTLSKNYDNSKIFEKCKNYAMNFKENSKSLFFSGSPGTGKTFLAQAIANEVAKSDYNALYFSVFDFNKVLLDYHLANDFDKSVYYDILTTCDLLVIDDLGCEPIYKNVTVEYLLLILSQRLQLNKPIIITTNLSPEKFVERYGERIYSRISSKNFVILPFKGNDLRKIHKIKTC